jgi:hypothetical protein
MDCATKYQDFLDGHRKTVPASITKRMTAFSLKCSAIYDEVAARVDVFNPDGASDIRQLAEQHHDSIAGSVFRGKKELSLAIDIAKRELLTMLKKCDI